MINLREGDEVWLEANEEEGWPRQRARVLGADERPWGTCVTVEVDPEDPHDDGIREVTEDQIEGLA